MVASRTGTGASRANQFPARERLSTRILGVDAHSQTTPTQARAFSCHDHPVACRGGKLKLHGAESSPEEDLQILQELLDVYRRALNGAPSGENAEIVAALRGANPRGIAVLATNHPALRADGQLLDRWGTPYFFHSISRERMEIISAGPDRQLWTLDDLREGPTETGASANR